MRNKFRPHVRLLLSALGLTCPVLCVGLAVPAEADTTPQHCVVDLTDGTSECSTSMSTLMLAGSQTLLARLYDAPNRSTADGYVDITASGSCDSLPDQDWSLGTMPAGWNDRVSSFQGYSSCEVKLWQNGGFSGASYGPYAWANSVGAMDNATSSVTFY